MSQPPNSPFRFRFARIAVVAAAASGFIATALAFLGPWYWLAELFVHFRPQYCVLLGLALIGAGLVRHRAAMVMAAAGLVPNVVALAPFVIPWSDRPDGRTPGRVWTVLTFNVRLDHEDPARVTEYLRSSKADIIVVHEISERWKGALEPLREVYPHGVTQTREDGFGMALFSREKPVTMGVLGEGGSAADLSGYAEWESEGRRFCLIGVHSKRPNSEWKARNQMWYLTNVEGRCRLKAREGVPVIVVGDFNATPWSTALRSFSRDSQLRNTNQGSVFGATWRKWEPWQLLIDHVFLSPDWKLLDYQVGPSVGSDHRPVIVRAALWSEKKGEGQ